MSTILKALRRLEREKSTQEGRPLKDEVTAAPAGGSRRRFPLLALMIAAGALGLGLGSSLLWLWPREGATPEAPQVAEAPKAPAPALPVAPAVPAPVAAPAPIRAALPEPSVASAPPLPVAEAEPPAPPVAVISRPEPPKTALPAPPAPAAAKPEPVIAKPAPPERGSQPPFARREASPSPAPAAAPKQVARANVPEVVVSSTVWHPQRDRRQAMVAYEGGAARELHEGDAIGPLVVSEIGPSGVVFLLDGVELRRRVGARN